MSSITTKEELLKALCGKGAELASGQSEWFRITESGSRDFLPFKTTASYLSAALSAPEDERDSILKQIIPDAREFNMKDYELADPLGEAKYSPIPGLVHRYPDRGLILLTDRCVMYCRHCFRRSFSGGQKGALSEAELEPMISYIGAHKEISELLITGGDPLTVSDSRLEKLLSKLKNVRPGLIIRICSRMPVVNPERISGDFVRMLAGFDGIWFITHFNHAAELTEDSSAALKRLVRSGIPVLNQTVLLRGVNDNIDSLKKLFNSLLQRGVKPYYLFQGDLAAGTSHLRVPLPEALELTCALKSQVSGMAMPRFAVDLPGGGGKVTLPSQSEPVHRKGDFYYIKGFDNEEYRYPVY